MTTTALQFLQSILPDDGFKCATVINNGRAYNKFFPTHQALADFIVRRDALGETVYHACAVYATPDSRKADNAIGASAFWIDVDAGEGKPYVDAGQAADAVLQFTRRHGLPTPTFVGSGNGVHAYWALDVLQERRLWQRYATGLKLLAHSSGLAADPSRTGDIASILRTPGTHHRKSVAKLVQCGPLQGPYPIERFEVFLKGEKDVRLPDGTNKLLHLQPDARTSSGLSSRPPSIIADAANIYANEPRYTEPAVRACVQLRALAVSNGRLSEPRWYAALGVLAACEDGERFAHHWSSGYAGYTFEETQGRLERSKEFGPTTCAKFESVNPGGCDGCPFKGKITSPIQLGRVQASLPPRVDERLSALPEELGEKKLPKGFALINNQLCAQSEDANGLPIYDVICGFPVELVSVQTGEIAQDFSISMKLEMPHEGTRSIILPAKTFFSASGMSEMAGQGVVVHDTEQFKKFVRDSMDDYNKAKRLERRYDQFGWKDDDTSFLFGGNLYTSSGLQAVIGSDEIRTRSQYLGPRRNGSLDKWRAAANQLFAVGHEVQSFALLASFAAPLMRFHSSGEGGAIVSLVSDRSGTGKTTALEAAASVWGRLKGTQIIDDDTSVAKGLKLGVFGNMACTYDELYNRDPEVIRKFVLMFTNGRDKDRGTSDGTLRHVRSEWQTILLLASNASIVDILSSMDGTDAPAYRVLEFIMDTPAGMDKKRGDQLKQDLDTNSGFGADLYLRTLLQPETLSYIKTALPKWTDQVWQRTGLNKEHRFWVRTIASVIAAGTIVKHAGILDFSVDRITSWAIEQVKGKHVETQHATNARDAVSMLVQFLDSHIMDTLVVERAFRPGPNSGQQPLLAPRRDLLIRHERQEGRIYVSETTLKKWLVKMGVNSQGFYAELKQKGVLGSPRRLTLGAGTAHASGQTSTLEIVSNHPAMSGHVAEVSKLAVMDSHASRVG